MVQRNILSILYEAPTFKLTSMLEQINHQTSLFLSEVLFNKTLLPLLPILNVFPCLCQSLCISDTMTAHGQNNGGHIHGKATCNIPVSDSKLSCYNYLALTWVNWTIGTLWHSYLLLLLLRFHLCIPLLSIRCHIFISTNRPESLQALIPVKAPHLTKSPFWLIS